MFKVTSWRNWHVGAGLLELPPETLEMVNVRLVSGRGTWNWIRPRLQREPRVDSQNWEGLCLQEMVRAEARNQVREES